MYYVKLICNYSFSQEIIKISAAITIVILYRIYYYLI